MVPRASELAAKLKVFAVGLFEGLPKCSDLRAVFGFQSGVFGGERGDDVVVGVFVGGHRAGLWPVLLPLVFDACSESSVVVEDAWETPASRWTAWNVTGSPRLIRRAMAESADRVFSSDLRRAAVLRTSMRRWRVSLTRLGSGGWWCRS